MHSKLVQHLVRIPAVAAILVIAGCKANSVDLGDAGGGPPPNLCATEQAGLNNPACKLTLGQAVTDYIRSAGDEVWYRIDMPSSANAQSILEVNAGYQVPGTTVDLSVALVRSSDNSTLLQQADNHGQGSPQPLDLLARYSDTTVPVLAHLTDSAINGPQNFDPRNPFSLVYNVVQDPNPHPPGVVTPIPLTNQNGVLTGSDYGYLAVPGDSHQFSVHIDPFSGRKILYLHLTAPSLSPPPPFRLSYSLVDSKGVPVSQDQVANAFLAVDLATARLILPPQAGDYTVTIQAYQPSGTVNPINGDLRDKWTIEFRLMDDVDPNEPNDSMATATMVSFSGPDTSKTLTGRIAYVPDPDWFAFQLPSNGNPTLFHYKLTPLSSGGRYPPLPRIPDRQLRAFTVVATGGPACISDPVACPKGYGNNGQQQALVEGFCNNPGQALCLQTERDESFPYPNLGNFEGMLTVPPQSGVTYYVLVQSAESLWSDDKDYQLFVEWLSDPAESSFTFSSGVKQPKTMAIAGPTAPATCPGPANVGATQLQGTLSYGFGNLINHDPNQGQGVRGPSDYDSTVSDTDVYKLNFPGGLSPPLDQGWELQWQVANAPYELTLALQFCDGSGGGACVPVKTSKSGAPLLLSYTSASLASWYNSSGPYQAIYDRTNGVTSVRPYGCFCIEPRFIQGGYFQISVSAADRNSYQRQPNQYTINTALTTYPQSYALNAGGCASCPAPVMDGGTEVTPGCKFTNQ